MRAGGVGDIRQAAPWCSQSLWSVAMQISVFGVGYVGTVLAACLAEDGHDVVAVDISAEKVRAINAGETPISEPGLPALIDRMVRAGKLWATTEADEAIHSTELTFICVGTPSLHNGNLDLRYVLQACEDTARALAMKSGHHSLVIRSTILPGATERYVIPMLRQVSRKEPGVDFGLGYHPEFMREGCAVDDFRAPAVAVFGALDEHTAQLLRRINEDNGSEIHEVDITTAEAIKYANNSWHALKITFANEIGQICKASGIDGRRVMSVLTADRKLNMSPAYLKPGFAFGGSCLPKDLRALRYHAKTIDAPSYLLDATLGANQAQIDHVLGMITRNGKRRVTMLGLTFKPDTDDLRESPLVELAERLIGKGFELVIYDRDLQLARLIGSNRRFAMQHLPHLSALLVADMEHALQQSDIVVLGTPHPSFRGLRDHLRMDHQVVDLVGHDAALREHPHYEGVCW
jgi:GDP-mannose 6-dehydrogenase